MRWGSAERGYAAALAAVVIWALVPVGTRYFVLRVDPYVFNVIRFAASGCAALPLCLHAKPWGWPAEDRLLLLACAVFAVPGYNLPVALGARTVPAGELGVIIATEPVMIALLTLTLQRRSLHAAILAGSALALAGVMIASGIWTWSRDFKMWSTLEVFTGAFSWSLYTVLAVRLNRRHGTFGVTGAIVVLGTLLLLALSAPMLPGSRLPDQATTLLLAGMGIASSLLGFLLWNYAGAKLPVERLGLFLYMIPLVSIGAGAGLLAESLPLRMLIGATLVVLGVWLGSRRPRTPSPRMDAPGATRAGRPAPAVPPSE